MIVELEVVVNDGVVGVVGLQKVFQCPRTLVSRGFYIMDLDRWKRYCGGSAKR
jgi:hypothetical protein